MIGFYPFMYPTAIAAHVQYFCPLVHSYTIGCAFADFYFTFTHCTQFSFTILTLWFFEQIKWRFFIIFKHFDHKKFYISFQFFSLYSYYCTRRMHDFLLCTDSWFNQITLAVPLASANILDVEFSGAYKIDQKLSERNVKVSATWKIIKECDRAERVDWKWIK